MAWEVDPNNLLPTPANYATPAQLASVREYAKALQQESTAPVKHWTMGLSNMMAALMGGVQERQANLMERGQREAAARILGGDSAAVAPSGPQMPAQPGGIAPAAGTYNARVAQLESGGNPAARTGSYSGTYQLSDEDRRGYPNDEAAFAAKTERNRRGLTQHLGRPPTEPELYLAHQQGLGGAISHLNNPDQPAWRSMRNTAEGQQKGDDWAKQAIWGNMTPGMKAQFPGGVETVPSGAFTGMWAQRYGRTGVGPAPAGAAGPPVGAPAGGATVAPAAQTMAGALAGPGVGPSTATPDQVAETKRQVRALIGMGAMTIPEGFAKIQEAEREFRPATRVDEYGTWIDRPGQIPQLVQRGQGKVVEFERVPGIKEYALEHLQFNPQTKSWERQRQPYNPVTGQVAASGGASAPVTSTPLPAPGAPQSPGAVPPAVPSVPPGARPNAAPTSAVAAPAGPQRPAPPPPGAPMEDLIRYNEAMKQYEIALGAEKKAAETHAEGSTKAYDTKFDRLSKMAYDAQDELPQLQMLQKVIQHPQFYSGLFSENIADLNMAAKALGLSEGTAATMLQLSKKLGAAGSLEQIREMGQQGAVRVPEMHMIEKSNFDPNNTPEANRAVVELRLRLAQRSIEMAEMARNYADAHNGVIDRGFDRMVHEHYAKSPLVSDAELRQYEEAVNPKTKGTNPMIAPLGPAAVPPPPPGFKVLKP